MARWSRYTYEMTAEALSLTLLKHRNNEGSRIAVAELAERFAQAFRRDNPEFVTEKFLETIAKKGGVIE